MTNFQKTIKMKNVVVKKVLYGLGGHDASKPNNNVVEVKEEQVAVPDQDRDS
jgi:hypothetical protein